MRGYILKSKQLKNEAEIYKSDDFKEVERLLESKYTGNLTTVSYYNGGELESYQSAYQGMLARFNKEQQKERVRQNFEVYYQMYQESYAKDKKRLSQILGILNKNKDTVIYYHTCRLTGEQFNSHTGTSLMAEMQGNQRELRSYVRSCVFPTEIRLPSIPRSQNASKLGLKHIYHPRVIEAIEEGWGLEPQPLYPNDPDGTILEIDIKIRSLRVYTKSGNSESIERLRLYQTSKGLYYNRGGRQYLELEDLVIE